MQVGKVSSNLLVGDFDIDIEIQTSIYPVCIATLGSSSTCQSSSGAQAHMSFGMDGIDEQR